MELFRQVAQISVFLSTILYVSAWQCKTFTCFIYPLSLKLWKDHIEVSSRSLKVKAGSSFSITCDGSCVGSRANPHLRWYGPDKHWIAYEGAHNRVHFEQSFSRRFQKLHIRRVAVGDQGEYICRGWLGQEYGWDLKSIHLIVEQLTTPPPATTGIEQSTSVHATTTHSSEIVTSTTLLTSRTTRTTNPTTTKTTGVATTTTTLAAAAAAAAATTTTTAAAATAAATTTTLTTSSSSAAAAAAETTTAPQTAPTSEEPCLAPNFQCGSGECLTSSYVCDLFPDCEDSSDEHNCGSLTCTEDMQSCTDGKKCVLKTQICDGVADCDDKSDESKDICNLLHV